jgi:hypothetical protein
MMHDYFDAALQSRCIMRGRMIDSEMPQSAA